MIIAAAVLVLAATLAPLVSADGDPASDTLIGLNVFYPYAPRVDPGAEHALNRLTTLSARQGFPVKVALIGRPLDLGVIPVLYGKPQPYANFLDQEISFNGKRPLLVVMGAGYGTQGLPAAAEAEAKRLPLPRGHSPTALANAAIAAIPRMAAAAGHRLSGVPSATGSGGSSGAGIVIAVVVVAVLVAAGAVMQRRLRRFSSNSDSR